MLFLSLILAASVARAETILTPNETFQVTCPKKTTFYDDGVAFGCAVLDRAGSVHHFVGTIRTRDATGVVRREVNYDAKGRQDGVARTWGKGGRDPEHPRLGLLEERFYDAQKNVGVHRVWTGEGAQVEDEPTLSHPYEANLRTVTSYKDGKTHGLRWSWNDEGAPQGVFCFVCGERVAVDQCRFDPRDDGRFSELCQRYAADQRPRPKRAPASH